MTLVRLITLRSAIFASLVKVSSCTPSAKKASSLLSLRFSNGSTAIPAGIRRTDSRLRIQQQVDRFVGCSPGKRRMASEQFVEYRAKSIDICGLANGRVVTYCLFRRHVAGRAHYFQ